MLYYCRGMVEVCLQQNGVGFQEQKKNKRGNDYERGKTPDI